MGTKQAAPFGEGRLGDVSACPHAAPRPAMGPRWPQLTACPKPGSAARSVLRRVRQRLRPVRKSFVHITIRSAGPGSHAHPTDSRSHRGSQSQARPAASSVSHWDQKDEGAASVTRRQAAEQHDNQSALGGERACSVTYRAWYSAPWQGNQNPAKI